MEHFLEQLDAQLSAALSSWNVYTTALVAAIVAYVSYSLFYPNEPDTHPMLLLRQSSPALVRKPGESAVYRSHETPHSYPLRTGLNVKPEGAPMYSAGKDGDLRDIWRRVTGELPLDTPRTGSGTAATRSESGKILTVFGTEEVRDIPLGKIAAEIAAIGEATRKAGVKRAAVYLPNSVELLTVLFAGAFFSFDVVLLPYNVPHASIIANLNKTSSGALIAEAGSLPLADAVKSVKGLKQVVWVVEETSRHMDWTEVPEDVSVDVLQWHEVVAEAQNIGGPLPTEAEPGKVVLLSWRAKADNYEITEFTQKNLVAAIGALTTSLPPNQRLNPSDLFLPADALADSYALCWTMAALFSHATVALNSVAGPVVPISQAAKALAPTVIVASSIQGETLHSESTATPASVLRKFGHYSATQALQAGRMPVDGVLTRLYAPNTAAIGAPPGKLRLLLLSERVGAGRPALSGSLLSDLRVYTGARVTYALTAPKVAGAAAQSNVYDYRTGDASASHGAFGAPLASVELKLRDSGAWRTREGADAQGEIVVSGPAVVGGEAALGVPGTFRPDGTLAYIGGGT